MKVYEGERGGQERVGKILRAFGGKHLRIDPEVRQSFLSPNAYQADFSEGYIRAKIYSFLWNTLYDIKHGLN